MAKSKSKTTAKKAIPLTFQITAVELANCTFNKFEGILPPEILFSFAISLQTGIEIPKKLVVTTVSVAIQNHDNSITYATAAVQCAFTITNFEEVFTIENGIVVLDEKAKEISLRLNTIAISTTRGFLSHLFKGTFLSNAVLPIINPTQFGHPIHLPALGSAL